MGAYDLEELDEDVSDVDSSSMTDDHLTSGDS